jgi:hypothetical protein
MRKVGRSDILPIAEYEKSRPSIREKMLRIKQIRRIHVGPHLTFLFENFDTVKYQVQEMMRAEQIADERQIAHELATYNELVGERGELGCTLLIEIDDPVRRAELLSRWLELPKCIFLKTSDGQMIPPAVDDRQVGEQRISSVHYLRFRVGDKVPTAVCCTHPDIHCETVLSREQTIELSNDIVAR